MEGLFGTLRRGVVEVFEEVDVVVFGRVVCVLSLWESCVDVVGAR